MLPDAEETISHKTTFTEKRSYCIAAPENSGLGEAPLSLRLTGLYALIAGLLVLFSCGCLNHPTEPDHTPAADYTYTIYVPALQEDSVRITCTVTKGTRFLLPFHYFDNPVDLCDGPTVRDLTIIDANGENVAFGADTVASIPVPHYGITLPEGTAYPVSMEYKLDLSVVHPDSTRLSLPQVHIRNGSLFLLGAHIFIIPEISSSLPDLWRRSCRSEVRVEAAKTIPLYGTGGSSFSCNTLYELLFIQLSGGQTPVASGRGGGVDFVFINSSDTTYPVAVIDSLSDLFARILDTLSTSFGPFDGAPYTVGFLKTWGGLEGCFGFMAGVPSSNIGSSFPEILAHEALHHFIGVRCGDYDDPWWKESAASYLGLETMIRLQFYAPEYLKKRMTTPFLYGDTARFQHALSDPWLRENMFAESVHGIVYERGAQVMMLLDAAIRLGSENRSSLLSVTAELCRTFEGGAFHRTDFLAALERTGMSGVEDFFARYVDDPFTVPDSLTLDAAFSKLDSLAGY